MLGEQFDAYLIVMLALVVMALVIYRMVLWFHPAVVEGEVIVEGEAAVVEAEGIVRRGR